MSQICADGGDGTIRKGLQILADADANTSAGLSAVGVGRVEAGAQAASIRVNPWGKDRFRPLSGHGLGAMVRKARGRRLRRATRADLVIAAAQFCVVCQTRRLADGPWGSCTDRGALWARLRPLCKLDSGKGLLPRLRQRWWRGQSPLSRSAPISPGKARAESGSSSAHGSPQRCIGCSAEPACRIHMRALSYVYPPEVTRMGRTNLVLDDQLVADCVEATGIRTRRALVDHALHELLRHERQKKVLELKGTVVWEGDLAGWRRART